MALPDLTGINIENSYQRVVHTDGTLYYDGTGSLLNIGGADTSSLLTTASFNAWTGSSTSYFAGTASYALTSSRAISASYALNGGVTQLLAGPNITLAPTNGLGQVTISSTAGGGSSFNTATGSYGSFYDTTIQTNPVGNIPRSMSLDTTDITNGVSISGSTNPYNTYIKTENAGVYDIQFSAQVEKTDSGTDEIVIWLRKNGIDLTDTATTMTLVGNSTKVVAAWNWFVTSAANDYYQIIWISADTGMRLLAETISGTHPGIPSVIVTANRVDQFLSNTGSFSGSFTGQFTGSLFGTSSWATNAGNSSTIDINVFGSDTESYLLMSNVAGTTGVAIGGDGDLRYNSSTNKLTVGSISATSLTGSLLGTASFASTASFLNSTTNAFIQNGNSFGATALLGTNDNQSLALETSGSTRMFISSSGNVGIGTSTPFSGGTSLPVGLDIGIWNSAGDEGNLSVRGYSSLGGVSRNSYGAVGSNYYLDTSSVLRRRFADLVSLIDFSAGGFLFRTAGNAAINSTISLTELMRITSTGNVGIGTNNPTNTLDLQSTATGSLRISGSGGSQITLVRPTAGLTGFMRYVGTTMEMGTAGSDPLALYTNNTARLYTDTNGNIGIGTGATSLSARLGVRGSGATSATTALLVQNSTPSTLFSILDNGNVGVGAITPTAAMDIITGSNRYAMRVGENSANTDGSWTGIKFQLSTNTSNTDTQDGQVNLRAYRYSAGNQFQILAGSTIISSSATITNGLVITGSLIVSGSGTQGSIDTTTRMLSYQGTTSVDWRTRTLNNSAGTAVLDWDVNALTDTLTNPSIDWENRMLWDATGLAESIDYGTRKLYNSTGSVLLDYETGVLTGTASTSSFVNTLNQNVIITGSLAVGTSSLGPNENTITLGARDAVQEGGQIGFNAAGGTYTSASFIDLYQNRLRILKGTNATSTGEVANWSMHNLQMSLPAYNSATAFPGTGAAMLTTDTSGNVQTQVYKDVAEQTYTGAIAWTGTASPSGSTTHTYRWSQIGKTVNLNITLVYTGPGNAVSTVTTALPADCPTPYIPSGQSGASALISVVSAHLTTTNTIGANIARGGLRINPTNNGYELTATAAASGYKVLVTSVQYFAV